MRQMFVNKVKETEAELKEKEREVRSVLSFCPFQRFSMRVFSILRVGIIETLGALASF